MKRTLQGLALVALAVGATVPTGTAQASDASGSTRVLPAAAAGSAGNNNSAYPFNCGVSNGDGPPPLTSARLQQAYGGSQLGAGAIDQIAFRLEENVGGKIPPLTVRNVTITMSTSTRGYDRLSPTFANNVGPDVVTVYKGDLTFNAQPTSGPGPMPFNERIVLQRPFSFAGTGSLLLDVTVPVCTKNTDQRQAFDAVWRVKDTVSRVAGLAGASSGNYTDSLGLVTQFHRR